MAGFLVYANSEGVPVELLQFDTFLDAAKAADQTRRHEVISCGSLSTLISKRPSYAALVQAPKEEEAAPVKASEPEIDPNLRRAQDVGCKKPSKPKKPRK